METSVSQHFLLYAQTYGYIGIYLWFLVLDTFSPIPDELLLLLIGYLCAVGIIGSPLIAGIVSIGAFLSVDIIEFFLSRKGAKFAKKIEHKLPARWAHTLHKGFQKHLFKTVFVLTFIPRMRVFAPFISGATSVSGKKYFTSDIISLTIFVSFYISLGFFFHEGATRILHDIASIVQHILFGIFSLLLLLGLLGLQKRVSEWNFE